MALSHVEFYAEVDAASGANPLLNVPSVAWGAGSRVYVIVTGKDDDAVVNTITATGLTFSLVKQQDEVTQQQVYMELWASGIAASSDTQTVAVQMTSAAHVGGLMASVLVVSGNTPTTDANAGAETGATDTTTPGVSVTTVAASTRIYYAFQTRSQTVTLDGADGLTSIRATDFVGAGGNVAGLTLSYKDVSSQGTYNGSGTITATDWVAIGWSVTESGTASVGYANPVRIGNRNVGPPALRRAFNQPVLLYREPTPPIGLGSLNLPAITISGTGTVVNPSLLQVGFPPVDITAYIVEGSLSIRATGYPGTGVMSLALTGPTGAFTVNELDDITWYGFGGELEFAGQVAIVRKLLYAKAGHVLYELDCQDYTNLLARNVVDINGVYPSGGSDADRIAALVTDYSDFGDMDAVSEVQTLVDVMPAQDFTGKLLSEAIDMVLEHSGGQWYIDFFRVLHTFIGAPARGLTTPFGVAATDVLTGWAHGLQANDTITFQTLSGGSGLSVATLYYVIASGLTADAFQLSTTLGGSAVNFTTAITAGTFVKTATADFGLSDAPDNVTTFGYENLSLPGDATSFKNRVYVIPGSAGNISPAWYEDTPSANAYGGYEDVLTADKVTTTVERDQLAAAFLLDHGIKRTGSLDMFEPGLHPKEIVAITSADHGLSAAQYRITAITTTYFNGTPRYKVEFGDPRLSLAGQLSDDAKKVAQSAAVAAIETYNNQREASAFPASPTTNDRFYRTDLGMWFYYDGTRWLSAELYSAQFQADITGATSVPVNHRAIPSLKGGDDIYMVSLNTGFYITGGTALSGSHKWTGTGATGLTGTNILINSGASDTWRTTTNVINALLGSAIELDMDWTKTGTPGTLFCFTELLYRIVAS